MDGIGSLIGDVKNRWMKYSTASTFESSAGPPYSNKVIENDNEDAHETPLNDFEKEKDETFQGKGESAEGCVGCAGCCGVGRVCESFWEGIDSDFDIAESCSRRPFSNWIMQGVVIRPLVSGLIVLFLVTLLLMVEPNMNKPLKVLTLEDFIYTDLQPSKLELKWGPTNDYVTWIKGGDIYGLNTTSLDESILVSTDTLDKIINRRIKITDYFLSYNAEYMLLAVDVDMVWDGLFFANYLILNLNDTSYTWLGRHRDSPVIANAKWSPTSLKIVFTSDNDISLYNILDNSYTRVTLDGYYPNKLNGRMSWIYQHEIYHNHDAIWWSPDGNKFAFFKTDETLIQSVPIHTFHDDYTGSIQIKYPLSGTINPKVSLFVYDVSTESLTLMPFRHEYITAVSWIDSYTLLYRTMNRIQNREYYSTYNLMNDTSSSFLSQEETVGWIPIMDMKYIGNSELVIIKQFDGYFHLHLYDIVSGVNTAVLTQGEWDVSAILAFDKKNRMIYYTSNEGKTTEQHIYGVTVPANSIAFPNQPRVITNARKLVVTPGNGFHSGTFNEKANIISIDYEGPEIPYQTIYKISLTDQFSLVLLYKLEENLSFREKISDFMIAKKIYLSFPSSDAQAFIRGEILLPPNLNLKKSYPLLVHVDSTPGKQTVVEKWTFGFDEYLASTTGIAILRLDPYGTGGRGAEFLYKIYGYLGKNEIEDYVTATGALLDNPDLPINIDPKRIGIWGSNIGGHIALSALLKYPDVFKAGIILDPIVNWLFYNSVFTERYMSLPTTNVAGYNETDILNYIPSLNDAPFLLIHGTEYNEVYSQNTAKLKKLLAYKGLKYQTISCADWPEDDKAHFYKLVLTYITASLNNTQITNPIKTSL